MPILSKPSSAARTSLMYITIGALIIIWSGVWWTYIHREEQPAGNGRYYVCTGLLITGATLLVIGLAVGQIGRSARHAELPPEEVTQAVSQAEQNAAARAPIVAPVNPAAPVATIPGQGAVAAVAPTPPVAPNNRPAAPYPRS